VYLQTVRTLSTDVMQMFFTSGTTGYPKMTQISCASYGLGHSITARYWLDVCETDVHWNLSDPGWAKSAYSNVFGPWFNGACVFIHSMLRMDPTKILQVTFLPSIIRLPYTHYTVIRKSETTKYLPNTLVI